MERIIGNSAQALNHSEGRGGELLTEAIVGRAADLMGGGGEPGTETPPKISALKAGVPMSGELPPKACCAQNLFCCPRKCLQMALCQSPDTEVQGRQGPNSGACDVASELPPLCPRPSTA